MDPNYSKYLKYKKKYMDLRNSNYGMVGGTHQGMGAHGTFHKKDEIWFWSTQMTEHALFLFLGLEDPTQNLKKGALDLHNEWKGFMQSTFWDKNIGADSQKIYEADLNQTINEANKNVGARNANASQTKPLEKCYLTEEDIKKIGNIDESKVRDLLERTIKFKENIVSILRTNVWIGWIFPSLAEHVLKEALYFKGKLDGQTMSADQEIKFINKHNMEEIGTTAQLIDPAPENNALIEKARNFVQMKVQGIDPKELKALQGMDYGEQAHMLDLSLRYSKELTKFAEETGRKIDNKELKSIISPILAHHVHREFGRFTMALEHLPRQG